MAAPGPVGPYWFRERSGMPLIQLTPLSGRSLSSSEREIALLRAQQVPVREIARQLARAPSTISRKLRRNAATRRATRLSRRNCAVGGRLQLQRPVPGIDPVGPSRHAPKAVGPHLGSLEHRTCSGPECRSSGWRRCGRRDACGSPGGSTTVAGVLCVRTSPPPRIWSRLDPCVSPADRAGCRRRWSTFVPRPVQFPVPSTRREHLDDILITGPRH